MTMKISVERKSVRFVPDFKKVIARFFYTGDERARELIKKVMQLDEKEVDILANQILREFSKRHRNISKILINHFNYVIPRIQELQIDPNTISDLRKILLGSYFTMEYSIESAAFFNPSVIEAPDQSDLEIGQKRIIVSFRATGEGHLSSIAFRSGIIDAANEMKFSPSGRLVDSPELTKRHNYEKSMFRKKLDEMKIPDYLSDLAMKNLSENFTYREIRVAVNTLLQRDEFTAEQKTDIEKILWLADSHYEIRFSLDTDISERVIFPVSETESKGIEDARFVRFVDDDGKVTYYATYTAFNGTTIMPRLLETQDFYHFFVRPLHGRFAMNKNLALFPRKIQGKYVMLSRIDGVNNYIMFSDKINLWEKGVLLNEPINPWEFIQIGNGGSPIETPEGWLLITHGVGPMRKYCLGAMLLDLDDPTKEIGRLKEPFLIPNEEEREGYVPNVVYTCGCIVHNGELIVPYAMSDYASSFVTLPVDSLIAALLRK